MQPVLQTIARIGPSDANVLITGEHGTGKEVVAQMLHGLSARAARSLVAVNTGALPEGTFESELFGHVKGAFTDARTDRIGRFELADGGTLFLDEIANVPLRQQAKLLRVLETGEMERVGSSQTRRVNVRVLSATNADLHAEVAARAASATTCCSVSTPSRFICRRCASAAKTFPLLAAHFLTRYASRYRKQIEGFEPAALQAMLQHRWPGNVRELDHTIERAVLMAPGSRLQAADLGLSQARAIHQGLDEMSLEAVESILIRKALAAFQWQRQPGGRGPRPEPWRALPADGKVWHLGPAADNHRRTAATRRFTREGFSFEAKIKILIASLASYFRALRCSALDRAGFPVLLSSVR